MGYVVLGILWCWWLEWFTTNKVDGRMGKKWIWRERIFHSVLWPFSVGIFFYNFFKEL